MEDVENVRIGDKSGREDFFNIRCRARPHLALQLYSIPLYFCTVICFNQTSVDI